MEFDLLELYVKEWKLKHKSYIKFLLTQVLHSFSNRVKHDDRLETGRPRMSIWKTKKKVSKKENLNSRWSEAAGRCWHILPFSEAGRNDQSPPSKTRLCTTAPLFLPRAVVTLSIERAKLETQVVYVFSNHIRNTDHLETRHQRDWVFEI